MKRRVFPRYRLHDPVLLMHEGASINAELIDISMRGAGLRTVEELAVGASVGVRLPESDLELDARVLYRKGTTFGLQFDELQTRTVGELRQWIFKKTGGHDVVTAVERIDAGKASFASFQGALVELRDVLDRVFVTDGGSEPIEEHLRTTLTEGDLLASLFIFRNRQHEAVGFCAVSFGAAPYGYASPRASRQVVVRTFGAVLPEYRGANLTFGPLLREVARFRARHPTLRPVLFLEVPDPSLYRLVAVHDERVSDDVHRSATPELQQLVALLAPTGVVTDEGARVVNRPWRIRETPLTVEQWHTDPLVGRFLALAPDYAQGQNLCMLLPLDAEQLGRMGLRYAARQVSKRAALSSAAAVRLEKTQLVRVDEYGQWAEESKPGVVGRLVRIVIG